MKKVKILIKLLEKYSGKKVELKSLSTLFKEKYQSSKNLLKEYGDSIIRIKHDKAMKDIFRAWNNIAHDNFKGIDAQKGIAPTSMQYVIQPIDTDITTLLDFKEKIKAIARTHGLRSKWVSPAKFEIFSAN